MVTLHDHPLMLTINRLMSNPDMRELIAQLMQEIQLIAAAYDCEILNRALLIKATITSPI